MKFFSFLLIAVLILTTQISLADTTCVNFPGLSESIYVRPTLANQITTAHFKIHWENPTTSTYANNAANYAEYAYQKMCVEMGWQVPPADDIRGGDNKYDIYLVNQSYIPSSNGVTQPEIIGNWIYEWSPSFILIRNTIETENQLKMVVAHEFNHASQLAYSCRDGSTDTWFLENTAVWVAEMVYNYAYKYYEHYFSDGADPLDHPEFGIHTSWGDGIGFYYYAGFLWPKFLAEWKNDNTIVKKIWQRLGQNPGDNVLSDINYILSAAEYESSLNEAARYYAEWRYFTGTRDDGEHFDNADELPTSVLFPTNTLQQINGFGGTVFLQYIPQEELMEISFDGEDNFLWSASIIQERFAPPSNNLVLPLNNYSSGLTDVATEECVNIVLTPVLLNDVTKIDYSYSTANYDARKIYFYNKKGSTIADGNLFLDNTTTIQSGNYKWLRVNPSTRNIKTLNERYQSPLYKHNNWNGALNKFYLNNGFVVQNTGNDQNANFIPLTTATIRNVIDGMSFNDGVPISFNDPWYVKDQYDNQSGMGDFISPPSPYNPTGKFNQTIGGIFLNQENDPNGQNPFYKVRSPITQNAPLTQTGKTHKFYFQSWGFSGTDPLTQNNIVNGYYESPVVFRNNNATVQAKLKGTQLSDNIEAYSSNSQNKFVRTENGNLHNVYISMGALWYERSTNNGATWEIANYGRAITTENPKGVSIDFLPPGTTDDIITIAYQCTTSTGSKVVVDVFKNGQPRTPVYYRYTVIDFSHSQNEYDEMNAEPVISVSSGRDIMVVYKVPALLPLEGNPVTTSGLYYSFGWLNGLFGWELTWYSPNNKWVLIPSTNYTSIHPAIAEDVYSTSNPTNYFHIAYQENNQIKYYYKFGQVGTGSLSQNSNPICISCNNGFSQNYSPSIISAGQTARVCWVGYRLVTQEGEYEVEAVPQYKVLFKDPSNTSRFWQFGNDVSAPSFNRSPNYYAFGWREASNQNKFADNTLSTVRSLNTSGQELQICNGTSNNNMYAMTFNHNDGLPYYFLRSENLGSFYSPAKITTSSFSSGREGIVAVDNAEFYFALGDINIDGQTVDFEEISDTVSISDIISLNQNLITKPMNISDNSSFVYSVQYGINDSLSVAQSLVDQRAVNFKVMLIDNTTGETIGIYDDVTYNSSNLYQYNSISYQVNTAGIGNRTIRLKLVLDNNFNANYSLSKIYSNESVLAKVNHKQIEFDGGGLVKEYA